jgi:hypothetical protein
MARRGTQAPAHKLSVFYWILHRFIKVFGCWEKIDNYFCPYQRVKYIANTSKKQVFTILNFVKLPEA